MPISLPFFIHLLPPKLSFFYPRKWIGLWLTSKRRGAIPAFNTITSNSRYTYLQVKRQNRDLIMTVNMSTMLLYIYQISCKSKLEVFGRKKERAHETREGRGCSLSPRVSLSRSPFFLAPTASKRLL